MAALDETNKQSGVEKPRPAGEVTYPWYVANLAFGDALVFFIFAWLGRNSHAEAGGLAAIPQIALTALPFALAWFLVAPFVGVYWRVLETRPRAMAIRTLRGWLLAWPLAMGLRWLLVDRTKATTFTQFLTFALVALLVNLVLLLIWRWPYAWYKGAKRREQQR
ncbi:MAG: DUF3054 domain-containing protein [Chloroflexota bacterium]|nr:DUF3054 domain-containing protein [Chloroflexota bacterium]